jgi:hypothetical protein
MDRVAHSKECVLSHSDIVLSNPPGSGRAAANVNRSFKAVI